jgi:hypothetical protein
VTLERLDPDDWGRDESAALRRFDRDHTRPVVLLLMRFDDSEVMQAIHNAVVGEGDRHGYDVVRADDRDYTGELWTNVELCIRRAQLVICVLEDIERRDCDANVMVELGFALGLGRRTLLLVERRLPPVPAVLRHRMTRSFDVHALPRSVEKVVGRWLAHDIGTG